MAVDTTKIHDTLYEYLHKYIPVQEITHAANEISKDPTEEKVLEMTTYLQQFDKEFIPLQTVNVKAVTNNQLSFAMSDVRKVIAESTTEEEPEEEEKEPTDEEGGDI